VVHTERRRVAELGMEHAPGAECWEVVGDPLRAWIHLYCDIAVGSGDIEKG